MKDKSKFREKPKFQFVLGEKKFILNFSAGDVYFKWNLGLRLPDGKGPIIVMEMVSR